MILISKQPAQPLLTKTKVTRKRKLGAKQGETKLLGLAWMKKEDTIEVKVSQPKDGPTKEDFWELLQVYMTPQV